MCANAVCSDGLSAQGTEQAVILGNEVPHRERPRALASEAPEFVQTVPSASRPALLSLSSFSNKPTFPRYD